MGLSRLAALHGVATSYAPSADVTVSVPDGTVVAVLAALGVDASTPAAVEESLAAAESAAASRLLPPTLVVWTGEPLPAALIALRPGTTLEIEPEEPDGSPLPPRMRVPGGPSDQAVPATAGKGSGTGSGAAPAASRTVFGTGSTGSGGTGTTGPVSSAPAPAPSWWSEPPLGVHRLTVRTQGGRSATTTLIVAPSRVPQPPQRTHGFLVQLYSLLSGRSWGMGDLGDLADLAAWSGRTLGAGFVQVNPLHAAVLGAPTDPSPYRPSSRRFPDPVHLHIESIPEYGHVPDRAALDDLRQSAEALSDTVLNKGALIDRDAVWELKRQALELVGEVTLTPGRRAAYCDFLAAQGQALEDHALWCALAELHGSDWHAWPPALRDPRSPQTARARAELLDRVDFHSRLAWLTDQQLAAAQSAARDAGMAVGIVHDLAVGVHPGGADAWAQQDAFARGMSVGAPPDAFNARGQDWGLPPWRPDVLAASGYAPYRGLLRGLLAHAGALRIDHVMGLFRLWWVPEGRPPTEGTYVSHDAEAMLAVLVLEAHRAGAVVIGEDLGTVEPGVREALARRGVLGTSVLWFERDWAGTGRPLPPELWREGCLATATTHDLPSTAARLTGDHVTLRHRLGLLTRTLEQEQAEDATDTAGWLSLLARLGLLPEGEGDEEGAVRAVHRFLLRTPARMVGVWLPDAVGDRRPQNLPGTWDQYPNWRLPIADAEGRPVTLEELASSARLHGLMEVLSPGRRRPRPRTAPPGARRS
ncbi:4-alpha-glucanotransferase [Streptomyces sp. NPDC005318]|uniref:4-alpha-glucanotransferase n=1 Tax=Streptomyces sp. NPDC005318 TaxID=3157031 RepID=UPI0033B1A6D1